MRGKSRQSHPAHSRGRKMSILGPWPLDYKGVYPQSDRSLAIVNIDASKGFVDLWVHLSFAIFAIFDRKRQLKLLEMAFDQVQTCLIFPFRWAHFPVKNSRKAQWVHPFSMNFNGFRAFCLYFSLKVHFRWEHHILSIKGCHAFRPE